MPEENVSMEKVSLDFSEDLGSNDFGIQDTQLLAGRDLQNFLLSDPDEVKKVEEEEEEEKPVPTKTKQDEPEKKPTTKKEEKPDGKEALDKILFGSGEEDTPDKDAPEEKPVEEGGEDETYKTLSKDLLRLGVFTKNSDDEPEDLGIEQPEQFLERFNLEKKKGAVNILDNFLSQFGEDYRKMFDAVFVNGVKPQEYLNSFAKIEAISEMNLEDESNQERVIRAYYKDLKWDEQKIESRIAKLKDYGDLEDEAKTFHEVLLNKEKEKAASIERQKAEEIQEQKNKELNTKKSYQRILHEKLKAQEIDGIPLTEKDAKEALDYLTEKKYKLASGELLSEYDKDLMELNRPENHELKIKLGLLLRKKLDLTSVKKTTISKKSDQLFTLTTRNAKNTSKEQTPKSFF